MFYSYVEIEYVATSWSSINKPGSKYSPGPIIYNRSLFKTGATDSIPKFLLATTLNPTTVLAGTIGEVDFVSEERGGGDDTIISWTQCLRPCPQACFQKT
jgi:hypothetical protein